MQSYIDNVVEYYSYKRYEPSFQPLIAACWYNKKYIYSCNSDMALSNERLLHDCLIVYNNNIELISKERFNEVVKTIVEKHKIDSNVQTSIQSYYKQLNETINLKSDDSLDGINAKEECIAEAQVHAIRTTEIEKDRIGEILELNSFRPIIGSSKVYTYRLVTYYEQRRYQEIIDKYINNPYMWRCIFGDFSENREEIWDLYHYAPSNMKEYVKFLLAEAFVCSCLEYTRHHDDSKTNFAEENKSYAEFGLKYNHDVYLLYTANYSKVGVSCNGRQTVPYIYDSATIFMNGVSRVWKGEEMFLIDTYGNRLPQRINTNIYMENALDGLHYNYLSRFGISKDDFYDNR